jgi:glucose/arabinose dehydrogenase
MKNQLLALLVTVSFFSCGTPSGLKEKPGASPDTVSTVRAVTDSNTYPGEGVRRGSDALLYDPDGPLTLSPHLIHLQKGVELTLNIPAGYKISVAYEGLRRLRFLEKSPDGRLFATDMYNTSDNKKGRVYIFEDWDSIGKLFRKATLYMDGLHNPNQVTFYNDKGKDYLYVSETGVLTRWPYQGGDTASTGKPDTIATFPDYGLGYKYGGWHLTRSVAFHKGKLYVSVGSSCNACIEKEEVRASVLEMDPDGGGRRVYASGLRNSVGMKWLRGHLWVTSMGRDLLGPDKPEDLFQQVEEGKFYGWPYYFQYQDSIYADTAMQRMAREQQIGIPDPPSVARTGFKAHSAPLGFAGLHDFDDSLLNDHVLVALHGSTTVSRQRGNSIVRINGRQGSYTTVVDGFLSGKTNADRKGRPCDVLQQDRRSFFFTDDHNGVLYYVWKEK